MRFHQAFERWGVHVIEKSDDSTLSFSESVLPHSVRLQSQPCTAQSIARLLNRDDIANMQYSLRKLVRGSYLAHVPASAKNNAFVQTKCGYGITDHYARIRHEVLVAHARNLETMGGEFRPSSTRSAFSPGSTTRPCEGHYVLLPHALSGGRSDTGQGLSCRQTKRLLGI